MSGTWKIPFFGVDRQYTNIKEHILSVTDTVLSTGQALDGEATTMFESDIAAITGRKYAVAVNSCSMALTFSPACKDTSLTCSTAHRMLGCCVP